VGSTQAATLFTTVSQTADACDSYELTYSY
jgi:hypothetical protein